MVTPVTVMEVAVSFEKTSKSLPFCSQSCLHSWCLLRSTTTHSPIRDSICRLYTLSYLLEFCLMIFLKMTFTSPCCSVAKSCLSDSLLLHGCWAPLSSTISQNLLKFISIESVMLSNHLILCHPLLLLPSIFPSIRVFSNKSALCIRWPKYWSFSFSFSPSNEYSRLISFRIDWFDLLSVQGTLKSLL